MSGARRYTVRPGHTFDLGGGKTAEAGDEIELADDVAVNHAHRIEPVQTAAPTGEQASGDDFDGRA